MNHRVTVVVPDRLAGRRVTYEAAAARRHGLRVTHLAGLAARLAGPFLQVADDVAVRRALRPLPAEELVTLAPVADLPGFPRAAARTLRDAWNADLDLPALAAERGGRWSELAALERGVLARLAAGLRTPRDVVAAARGRVRLAPTILGDVILDGLDDVPPVYRPLLADLAGHVEVRLEGRAAERPAGVPDGVTYRAADARAPATTRAACADPHHEVVEALRWARALLADGVPPGEIAIAAAATDDYDDALLALVEEANLPLHAARGVPALTTRDGQVAAALADVLLRGLDGDRVHRFVSLARRGGAGARRLGDLPDGWARALPREAPLSTPDRWERGLAPRGDEHDEVRGLLRELGVDLARGVDAAEDLGGRWLRGRALRLWRRALDEGPAAALDVSLDRLRVDDGVDPAAAIVWAPASALAASPRPHARLLGLASRSWPRRAADDPLLPAHVLGGVTLHERSLPARDRADFEAIAARTSDSLALSRAVRDAEGRKLAPSPLLRGHARDVEEVEPARRAPAHAFSEADRRLARPRELAADPHVRAALDTWIAWLRPELTPHDGLVRADHPALHRALSRLHSATSLKALLRNPLGFVWTYALRLKEPAVLEDALTLDPLERGSLIHEVLEAAVLELEEGPGLARAAPAQIAAATDRALGGVEASWTTERPVPPEVLWRAALDEARAMAIAALSLPLDPLPGQRSYAEVPFGARPRDEVRDASELPWDPDAEVRLPGTELRINGRIDRLDLARDGRAARVVDYKSSRKPPKPKPLAVDVDEGKELQRCLYAFAVRERLGADTAVDAMLVYPATGEPRAMRDTEGTLDGLTRAVRIAVGRLAAGWAVPGDDAFESWFDLRLALPAHATNVYRPRKEAALAEALEPIRAILSAEPDPEAKEATAE